MCEADDAVGDEEETLEKMAARLRKARAEEEARLERARSLEARGVLNARKGFVHGLRVGEVDGAEHGAMHDRRCETETARVGRARASVEGIGPRPQLRGLGGGCACCGWQGGCTRRVTFCWASAAARRSSTREATLRSCWRRSSR